MEVISRMNSELHHGVLVIMAEKDSEVIRGGYSKTANETVILARM
jgi:hypothetical protein